MNKFPTIIIVHGTMNNHPYEKKVQWTFFSYIKHINSFTVQYSLSFIVQVHLTFVLILGALDILSVQNHYFQEYFLNYLIHVELFHSPVHQ